MKPTTTQNTTTHPQPEEQESNGVSVDNGVDGDLFDPEFDEPTGTVPRSRFLDPEAQEHVNRAFPERPTTAPAAAPVPVLMEKPKSGVWAATKGFFRGAWWLIEAALAFAASWGLGSLFAMAFTPTAMDFLYSTGHLGFFDYHWARVGLWFHHYSPTYATCFLAVHLVFTASVFLLSLFVGRGK